ncbi:hypothetical protein [Lujinxingia vulgaris]|nr:hypothetical protein [Lujinxingia vulgaris]
MRRNGMGALILAALLVLGAGWGCGSETPGVEAPPRVVRALWNPTSGELPTPTDLLRDDDLGRLNLPVGDALSDAEREFRTYLNTLDAYPLSSAMRFPLSGPVQESSLLGAVVMVEEPGMRTVQVRPRYDAELEAVIVELAEGEALQPGRRYTLGLRGYAGGARGAGGELLVADAAFFLLRSEERLTEHPDALPGATRAEREALAAELTALQEDYIPAMEVLASRGIPREEIAAMTQFTTTSLPAIAFDSASGRAPLPNALLTDETGRVALPVDADDPGERAEILRGLNGYDGFSISGAMRVESTASFGEGVGQGAELRVFRLRESGRWEEVVDLERGRFDDASTLWVRPRLTLEPQTTYAYVVAGDVPAADGRAHRPQPLGAMLMLEAPLVAGGRSELGGLTDSEAQRLEPVRAEVDGLLRQLEAEEGLDRSTLAAAVPFKTASSASTLLARRQKLYDDEVRTSVISLEVTEPSGGTRLLLNSVDAVVRGQMFVADHLDPATRAFFPDGRYEERAVDFVMTLPKDVSVAEPLPVVLFGHGLMTSRELLYLIAEPLAAAGYAAFALDLPYHGERAVCLTDQNCEGNATCDALGRCLYADGSRGRINRVEVPWLLSLGNQFDELLSYPSTSGTVFIDMERLFGTRDHFAQAVLDLQQAVRVLQSDDMEQAIVDTTGLWVGDEIVYLGMSLGGILGSSLSAVEPEIVNFVLNVPAADLVRIIEHSVSFETAFEHALHARGIEHGSDAYVEFVQALRWILDPVDPLNLVQHTLLQPLPGHPTRRVLIQMASGDRVVPNEGTRALSERMGVAITEYEPGLTDHGFLFNPNPLAYGSRTAREDMVEFFNQR